MIHAENRLAPRMVLIITNHEYRRKLEQTFQNFRIPIYYQCQGHGTAPSEMLDIFGLSGSGRLLTIGLLPKFLVRDLLDATVKLRDGKKPIDMELNLVEKMALKKVLGKIEGTDIEKLLKEYHVI